MRGLARTASPLQIFQYGAIIAKKALARPDFYRPTPTPLRMPQRSYKSRAGATQQPLKAMRMRRDVVRLFGRQDHHHGAAFKLGILLNDGNFFKIGRNSLQQLSPAV